GADGVLRRGWRHPVLAAPDRRRRAHPAGGPRHHPRRSGDRADRELEGQRWGVRRHRRGVRAGSSRLGGRRDQPVRRLRRKRAPLRRHGHGRRAVRRRQAGGSDRQTAHRPAGRRDPVHPGLVANARREVLMATERQYMLTLGCPDRTGIVARIAGFLAESGAWITEAAYHADPDTNWFFTRQAVRADSVPFGLEELRSRFGAVAADLGGQANWKVT